MISPHTIKQRRHVGHCVGIIFVTRVLQFSRAHFQACVRQRAEIFWSVPLGPIDGAECTSLTYAKERFRGRTSRYISFNLRECVVPAYQHVLSSRARMFCPLSFS